MKIFLEKPFLLKKKHIIAIPIITNTTIIMPIVKLLLSEEYQLDINAVAKTGETAVAIAAMNSSSILMVQYLLKQGALINSQAALKYKNSLCSLLFKRCYVCNKNDGQFYCKCCNKRFYCSSLCQINDINHNHQ